MNVNTRRKQHGATLLEAGITAIALCFLLFGIVEFGRAYNIYQNVTNAAREGARYAVAPFPNGTMPSAGQVVAHVTPLLESNNITVTPGMITITPATQTVNGLTLTYTNVTVSVTYHFFFIPAGGIAITANSEMRNETN
jgi:Flp pilus assembly protein TadG